MKKIVIMFVLILFCFALTASAEMQFLADAGYGFFDLEGKDPQGGYFVGTDLTLLEKMSSSFSLIGSATYVYVPLDDEVQVLRSMVYGEKNLYTTWKNTVEGPKKDWRIYIGFGTGAWTFMNTQGDDETYGAVGLRGGAEWNGITVSAFIEDINLPGDDALYYGLSGHIGL